MAHSVKPSVRLERQPHRDAVSRLREAYRRLRQVGRQRSSDPVSLAMSPKTPHTTQEVSV